MRVWLPFLFAVHYAARGTRITYENTPWKIVWAKSGQDAIRKFNKKYPNLEARFALKI